MKVKKLIEELKKCDPEAEAICGSAGPLYCVEEKPGYYDGCTDFLIQDEDNEYYNIIGYGYDVEINKVVLTGMGLEDCLYDLEPEDVDDFPVELPKGSYYAKYRERIAESKEKVKKHLTKWALEKVYKK